MYNVLCYNITCTCTCALYDLISRLNASKDINHGAEFKIYLVTRELYSYANILILKCFAVTFTKDFYHYISWCASWCQDPLLCPRHVEKSWPSVRVGRRNLSPSWLLPQGNHSCCRLFQSKGHYMKASSLQKKDVQSTGKCSMKNWVLFHSRVFR